MEMEELELLFLDSTEKMDMSLENLRNNFSKISVGRANPKILDSLKIEYYESMTPVNQVANISIPEPNQLLITPFDKSTVKSILLAIKKDTTLDINPQDEGDKIRINIPPLTMERRTQLVKQSKDFLENCKIYIRQMRQHLNKEIKDIKLSEDEEKKYLKKSQDLTDKFIHKADDIFEIKKKDLLNI